MQKKIIIIIILDLLYKRETDKLLYGGANQKSCICRARSSVTRTTPGPRSYCTRSLQSLNSKDERKNRLMSPLRVVFTTTTTSGEWRVRGIFESSARTSLVGVEEEEGNQQLFFSFTLISVSYQSALEVSFIYFFRGFPLKNKKKCELRMTNGSHCDTCRQRAVHHRRHGRVASTFTI